MTTPRSPRKRSPKRSRPTSERASLTKRSRPAASSGKSILTTPGANSRRSPQSWSRGLQLPKIGRLRIVLGARRAPLQARKITQRFQRERPEKILRVVDLQNRPGQGGGEKAEI